MVKNKKLVILACLVVLLAFIVLFSTIGSVDLSLAQIFSALRKGDNPVVHTIVYQIRLPRNLLAVLVGAGLSISGVLLQAVMKNPLADPGITGLSTGASVFAIVILLLLPQYTSILPIMAFFGGAIACGAVYFLAWKNGLNPFRMVLSGVAVNAILGSVISLLTILYSDRIQSALLWLNGSLANKTWKDVGVVAVYILIGLALSFCCIRGANVLSLGDITATNLGFRVSKTRLLLSLVAVFLAASATAVVGVIGFVGLIVPHISRILMGSDHKYVIPFSMALGGIVLLVADTVARTAFGSLELPVGVVMALVGGPFFLYLLRTKRGEVSD